MSETAHVLPPRRRAIVTLTVMVAATMVALDVTIANVALPHMQAALGATPETISWVLTSYIIASAIAMPVTGWLADRLGRRLLFTVAIAGFGISSALCGAATTLEMMVAMRILQGVFGAFLLPISQAVLYDINPPERHAKAMALWGMGVMVAPVIGPFLGGVLTDSLSWRWVFLINLPISVLATVGSWVLLSADRALPRRFDAMGFVLLGTALGAFQLMLDRGPHADWFSSTEIWIESAVALAAFWMFVVHSMTARSPLLPPSLFANANFLAALVVSTVVGGIMMTGAALTAPLLQSLLGYPVREAGIMMMPRGVGMIATMMLSGQLANRFDPRLQIAVGLLLIALSLYMMCGFNLAMSGELLVISSIVQGAGMGMIMVPMNYIGVATLPSHLRTDAASLLSLARNIGGSVAISAAMAMLARNVQINHSEMADAIAVPQLPHGSEMAAANLPGLDMIVGMIDAEVNRQALMIAYINDFWAMMWACLLAVPLVFLMRKVVGRSAEPAVAH